MYVWNIWLRSLEWILRNIPWFAFFLCVVIVVIVVVHVVDKKHFCCFHVVDKKHFLSFICDYCPINVKD